MAEPSTLASGSFCASPSTSEDAHDDAVLTSKPHLPLLEGHLSCDVYPLQPEPPAQATQHCPGLGSGYGLFSGIILPLQKIWGISFLLPSVPSPFSLRASRSGEQKARSDVHVTAETAALCVAPHES